MPRRFDPGDVYNVACAANAKELQRLEKLIRAKILGPEQHPAPNLYRWQVLKPAKLPNWLMGDFDLYGEIRWCGGWE